MDLKSNFFTLLAHAFIDRLEVASCTPLSRDPTRTRNLRFAGASCQTQPAATRGVLSPIFRLLADHRAGAGTYAAPGVLSKARGLSDYEDGRLLLAEEGFRSPRAEMKTRFYLSFIFFLGSAARGRVGHAAAETLFIDLPAAQPSPRTAARHRLSTRALVGL